MDMSFTNKALQHMTDFAIQFNKNRSVLVFLFTVIGMIYISLNNPSIFGYITEFNIL